MSQSQNQSLKGFVRKSPSAQEVINKLGPLVGLVGNWNGNQGWNLIAVPSQQTNLNFIDKMQGDKPVGLIMWPHMNVNTLVKE